MDNLRRLNFFEKRLVTIHSTDNITSVVDVAGSETNLWILESNGFLHTQLKALDDDGVLRSTCFRAFEHEASRLFYCKSAECLVVLGKNQESDDVLKFNTYSLTDIPDLNMNNKLVLVQSMPLFVPQERLPQDHVLDVVCSECATLAVVACRNDILYFYVNYLVASLHDPGATKCFPVSLDQYLNRNCELSSDDHMSGTTTRYNNEQQGTSDSRIKNLILKKTENTGSFILTVVWDYMFVTFDVSGLMQNMTRPLDLILQQNVQTCIEKSCNIKDGFTIALSTYCGNIQIYNVLDGSIQSSFAGGEQCTIAIEQHGNYILEASAAQGGGANMDSQCCFVHVQSNIRGMNFVAHSQYIPRIYGFQQAMDNLYIIASKGATNFPIIFQLKEKNIHERLQILVRKRLFDWAIQLAKIEQRPHLEIEQLHLVHAEWLYSKERYNEAIDAYCKAGSSVEPAVIIDLFLCLTDCLYRYLLHLHSTGVAARVHTLLLMRTLEKLYKSPDTQTYLAEFIEIYGEAYKLEISAALEDCRSNGNCEFAKQVALLQADHLEYVNIMVEDFGDYTQAIQYMADLENTVQQQVVCNAILKHGRLLMQNEPNGVLRLIESLKNDNNETSNIHEAFIPVFATEEHFLQRMLNNGEATATSAPTSNMPLIIFTTKLHLLLQQFAAGDDSVENNLWKLVNTSTLLEDYQFVALVLCIIYKYKRGVNAMSIKMGYYHLPLVLSDGGFDLLQYALHYGSNEPTLWVGVTALLARRAPNILSRALEHVQRYKLLSFTAVLDILKGHGNLKMRHVKDYLVSEFTKFKATIQETKKDISQDKAEYASSTKNLQQLQQAPYEIVNGTNCSKCDLCLEVPCLVYYCQHWFHAYCIDSALPCQKCPSIIQETQDYVTNVKKRADCQDNFFKFLSGSADYYDFCSRQYEKFGLESFQHIN